MSSVVEHDSDQEIDEHGNMMAAVRRYAETYWPYERLLPSDEPIYVTKLFYMFGSLALMSFVSLVVTGCILVFRGPYWWHTSDFGLFFNSLHFWSCQLFFFCIFVHFGSSFFTAAGRGGRGLTWFFGVLTFFVAILTGLTGYVLQSNYDGQYIGQQAKDAINSVGLGKALNLMNLETRPVGTGDFPARRDRVPHPAPAVGPPSRRRASVPCRGHRLRGSRRGRRTET